VAEFFPVPFFLRFVKFVSTQQVKKRGKSKGRGLQGELAKRENERDGGSNKTKINESKKIRLGGFQHFGEKT